MERAAGTVAGAGAPDPDAAVGGAPPHHGDAMTVVFAAIGRFAVRFRWPVIAAWLAATVLCVHFLPSLSSVSKSSNTEFLPASTPSMGAARLAGAFESAQNPRVVVVVARRSPLTAADEAAVSGLAGRLRAVPRVVTVRELGVSPDGAATQLAVELDVPRFAADSTAKPTLLAVRGAISATPMPAGLTAHTAGQLASEIDGRRASAGTDNRTQLLSIVFILALLLAVFRSVLAPLVTLIPAAVVVQLSGPVIAEAARAGVQVSSITQLMLIVLILGAGTDYGLFLVFRVREELRAGRSHGDAIVRAVTRVGESVAFSAATVIAALLSLLMATFGIYQSLGVPLAIGVFFMLLAGLTLLPALLAVLGRAVFWPSRIRAGQPAAGWWGRVAGRVVRHPALTLAAGAVFFGALAVAALGNRPAGFGGAATAPAGTDSAAGQASLAAHFPKASANPTVLVFRLSRPAWDDPSVLERLAVGLSDPAVFRAVLGPLDPTGQGLTAPTFAGLHARLGPPAALPLSEPPAAGLPLALYNAYRATAQFVSPDGRTVQFAATLTAGAPDTTAALQSVPAVRAAVARAARTPGVVDSGVAGQAPGGYDVSVVSSGDLRRIVPVVVVIIAVLLALVMRSLVAPLYLVASVVLSYLAALGLAVLLFIHLGGQGGLTFILPFLMFVFLLALGEDYNILVMTRIREEAHDLPLREAVTRALGATGTTVTSAGLVLAGTFGVLAVVAGNDPGAAQIRAIGSGLALGVLMDSFLVRTLLVPSAVVLLGRLNWWPSPLARRPAG